MDENSEKCHFLALFAKTWKLLRYYERLIRQKLDWLNKRCLKVSLEFVVSKNCKPIIPHCKHLLTQSSKMVLFRGLMQMMSGIHRTRSEIILGRSPRASSFDKPF